MYQTTLPPPIPAHQNTQRNSALSLDYDLTSSSDESDIEYKYPSEEHKFWQVHSSTTIIAPPTVDFDASAISMNYMPRKNQPKRQTISLVSLVSQSLRNTFDDVDKEIEKEWETSRTHLLESLSKKPLITMKTS